MDDLMVAQRPMVSRGTPAALRRSPRLQAPFMLLSYALGLLLISPSRGAAETTEYDLKAAYLLNFARFIEWPAGAFSNESSPIVFAVAGQDPFGPILEKTLKNKKVGIRPIVVKKFEEVSDIQPCHILFVSTSLASKLPQVLEKLKGTSTVTVGESDGFARKGGVFRFLLQDNKVRFEINVDTTKRLHLEVSAKLLQVAIVVRDE